MNRLINGEGGVGHTPLYCSSAVTPDPYPNTHTHTYALTCTKAILGWPILVQFVFLIFQAKVILLSQGEF